MSTYNLNRSGRQSPSRSLASSSMSPPGSRPFLNLLNPIGRHYQGYTSASLVEQDEDLDEDDDEDGTPRGSFSKSRTVDRVPLKDLLPNDAPGNANDSSDDEVPQSFMIEANPPPPIVHSHRQSKATRSEQPSRRASSSKTQAPILPTHNPPLSTPPIPPEFTEEAAPEDSKPFTSGLNERERALWNWVNVYNLDAYLQDVYAYYEGKGIYSIALARGLNLLTVGFVIFFSTFLLGCVDYSQIRHESTTRLSDVVVDHCVSQMSGFSFLFFTFFGAFWIWQIVSYVLSIVRLLDMYRFYTHLLDIPDVDIQTISWPEIVRRIAAIRDSNPVTALSSDQQVHADSVPTAKLDAHDIANRIMRQENYLIALFNKELLDLRVPVPSVLQPYLGRSLGDESKKGQVLTRALEWNLRFCLMSYLFDSGGRVRKMFLRDKNRSTLVESLERRFIFMGFLNAIFAPFIVLYLLMYSFFRYFEEYRNNPSSVGGRQYTPFAQWKFREFNELPHLFTRRLNESYPYADEYINQFPKEQVALVARFAAFIAGSFAAVLLLASVIDPELFLHFEITPHRTVAYYLTILGSILAVTRGMIPDKRQVFDPERVMKEVVLFTHYMPAEWKGNLHSQALHKEFGQLFAMKVAIFAQELISVVLTPWILWFTLPLCAPAIVDFFREFTVHVDGLGNVCSFAVFDFQRHGNVNFGVPAESQDVRLVSKEGKMEKSFLNFKAAHPDWVPNDPSGSLYLTHLADMSANYQRPSSLSPGRPVLQHKILAERAQRYEQAMQRSLRARPRKNVLATSRQPNLQQSLIPEEERSPDGGVQSELGDSYVEDVRTRGGMLIDRSKPFVEQSQNEMEGEDELANGGFMGLLTQIYDQRGQVI